MSGVTPEARSSPASRRRGISLSVRVASTAAIIIILSNAASIFVQYYGFPPFGYMGRDRVNQQLAVQGMTASADTMLIRIGQWFTERKEDAKLVGELLSRDDSIDRLIDAAREGWPPQDRGAGASMGSRLASLMQNNIDIDGVRVVDRATGRLIADTLEEPFGRAVDVSWLGPTPAVRVDADDRCVVAAPFLSPRGARIAVLLYVRTDELFNQIRAHRLDAMLGLDLAILDNDLRVLFSSDQSEFRQGGLALPIRSSEGLKTGRVDAVSGSQGEKLIAGIFDIAGMGPTGFKLLVSTRHARIEAVASMERQAAAIAALLATLAGLLLVWLSMRRLFKPLVALESAITAFALGKARPPIPQNARGDIGLIADAMGDMMERVTDWRRQLETEVAERTAELRTRSEAATLFANQEDDELAYLDLIGLISRAMGATEGLMAWMEEYSGLAYSFPLRALRSVDGDEFNLLRTTAAASRGPLTLSGREWPQHVTRRLEIAPTIQALVVVLSDSPFEEEKIASIDRLLAELTPLMRARSERRRQEAIRLEAERSLRRSEERLRTFFEDSHDMIYSANAEDVIASMNSAGLALLGFTDRFEVVGKVFSAFALNKEDRRHFLQKIREQGFASDYEIVLKRANGQTVFCLETAQVVKDREGRIIEIQGIIKDISERINTERELWRTNMELAEANARLKETQMVMVQNEKLASIGQLAAGIAHEINNPLGFLKSNHGVLTRFYGTVKKAWLEASSLDPELHQRIAETSDLDYVFGEIESVFTESDEGYRRIMDIVSNLKSFARSETETAITAYDLNKGVESTLTVARNEIKYVAEVELQLSELPQIEAAGGEINQVLLNLLVNSAQAIAGQKRETIGHIKVATGVVENRIYCIVSDDGPGIPADLRLRIFDPFFTTKEPGKGTGLGLSISHDIIVNKHGGRLVVDEAPGGGARFRFELPIKHVEGGSSEKPTV